MVTKPRLMNGAGSARSVEDVQRLAQIEDLDEITIGTFTAKARPGNSGTTFSVVTAGGMSWSINSLGMPNDGFDTLYEHVSRCFTIAKAFGKRLRVSIAGDTEDELASLFVIVATVSPEIAIEINLGCPNIWKDGAQHEIWSFSPALVQSAMNACTRPRHFKNGKQFENRIALKLSIFSQPSLLAAIADTIVNFNIIQGPLIQEVVYSNTFPNSWFWNFSNNSSAISPAKGLGGGAGAGILPFVLGGVRQLVEKFRNHDIAVTSVGGIVSGYALAQHLMSGAVAHQMTTAIYEAGKEPARAVSRILSEFVESYPDLEMIDGFTS